MDSQKRLVVLKNMLNRLTGGPLETPEVAQTQPPQQSVDPDQRRLQVLRSMLSKLQGS